MIPTGWSAPHFTSHPPASLFPLTLPLSFCSWFGLPHEVAPPPSLSPTSAFLPPLSRSSSHCKFSHLPSHLLSHIILTHPTHSPPTLSTSLPTFFSAAFFPVSFNVSPTSLPCTPHLPLLPPPSSHRAPSHPLYTSARISSSPTFLFFNGPFANLSS